ncbi:hypothetical protein [Pseudomonas putida]|uniref:hypothetical protein n=1 Tax=Pseudomonas putida TaxID=303 RepID=UPI00119824CD|nr:hypothetical protein [Pseudomonas putida]
MRLEFAAGIPWHEQLLTVSRYRKPGRKHRKTPPNRCVQKKNNTVHKKNIALNQKAHYHNKQVADFWAGLLEEYPY